MVCNMQEKVSIVVALYRQKFPSLGSRFGITKHGRVMPNRDPWDRNFCLYFTAAKGTYKPLGQPHDAVQLPLGKPRDAVQLPLGKPFHVVQLPLGKPCHVVQLPHGEPRDAVQLPLGNLSMRYNNYPSASLVMRYSWHHDGIFNLLFTTIKVLNYMGFNLIMEGNKIKSVRAHFTQLFYLWNMSVSAVYV